MWSTNLVEMYRGQRHIHCNAFDEIQMLTDLDGSVHTSVLHWSDGSTTAFMSAAMIDFSISDDA